jgi:hypothetical protein
MVSRARMANHGEVGSWPCCEAVVGAYERRVLASDALGVVMRARGCGYVGRNWMCESYEEVVIDEEPSSKTTASSCIVCACACAWTDGRWW